MPDYLERLDFDGHKPRNTAEALLLATPRLLDGARAYADKADDSYRGQNVGNGSLAIDAKGRYFAIYSANYKAGPTTQTLCAEARATPRAQLHRLQILAFCIDAMNQPDTKSGYQFPTLLPCSRLCIASVKAMRHPTVSPNVTIIGREKGTYKHVVVNRDELGVLYDKPTDYPELADEAIEDAHYTNLTGGALDMHRMLMADMPEANRLSAAVQVRIAWNAANTSKAGQRQQ